MKTTITMVAALTAMAMVGCAEKAADDRAASSADAISEGDERSDIQSMNVDDLDGDGQMELFTTTRDQCGTGGCTWKINLTSLGEAGEAFALNVMPLPQGSEDQAAGFFAHSSGGVCLQILTRYSYNAEAKTYEKKSEIDCLAVARRAKAGGPVAQFEWACLDLVDVDACANEP